MLKYVYIIRQNVDKVTNIIAIVGSCLLFSMMILMSSDVIARYVATRPINGADEVVGFLLLCLSACAIVYCQQKKKHIRMTLLFDRLSPRVQDSLDTFSSLLGFIITSLMAWQLFYAASKFVLSPLGNTSRTLNIPWFPFMIILGIGFVLFLFIFLIDICISISKLVKK